MWIFFTAFLSLVCALLGEELPEGCMSIHTLNIRYAEPKVIQVTRRGNLYSPGFEKNESYPDSVQCSYKLQAPEGMHVQLKFNTLDIDVTDQCASDSVSIHDLDFLGKGILLVRLCGKQLPYDYVSKSDGFLVVLQTDDFAARRGFNITYWPQDSSDVCSVGLKQCRNRNCVEYSKLCDANDDCGDGTDEEKCSRLIADTTECGKPDIKPLTYADNDRIVGGQEALQGSWPWMADLQMKLVEPNGHLCGGTLINAQWVLTAAHCFKFPNLRRPDGWRIHLGNHHKFERDEYEQIRYVERIVIYDDIPPFIFERDGGFERKHDMALIKLNAPVKFTKYVKPVCLPDLSEKLNITSNCYATGWGATRGSGASHVLKQAYHPVQPDIICTGLVGTINFNSKTMICAGSMGPLNGVCHGDSGGPLVCEIDKEWKVVGVASYVTAGTDENIGLCGLQDHPSVFNKVAVKTEWIRRIINRYT